MTNIVVFDGNQKKKKLFYFVFKIRKLKQYNIAVAEI
jgi:hypothetical protein